MANQVLSAKTMFTRCSLMPAFLSELVAFIGTRRVLEIFAGDGLLAWELIRCGIGVTATGFPAPRERGGPARCVPVAAMEAVEAVRWHQAHHDVLLVSWPPASPSLVAAVRAWGAARPIVYIGERPPPDGGLRSANNGAIVDLFDQVEVRQIFMSYLGPTTLDQALVLSLKPEARGGRR